MSQDRPFAKLLKCCTCWETRPPVLSQTTLFPTYEHFSRWKTPQGSQLISAVHMWPQLFTDLKCYPWFAIGLWINQKKLKLEKKIKHFQNVIQVSMEIKSILMKHQKRDYWNAKSSPTSMISRQDLNYSFFTFKVPPNFILIYFPLFSHILFHYEISFYFI